MVDFFIELFAFYHHINKKMIDIIEGNNEKQIEKSLQLLSHILTAHHIWNTRINQVPSEYGVWELQEVGRLLLLEEENYSNTLHILKNKDLKTEINYKTSQGKPFQNNIKDILFHVVNHSTHHRAQISSDIKHHGIEPLITDYIFYKR